MATKAEMIQEVLDGLGFGRTTNTRLNLVIDRRLRRELKTLCGQRDWWWKQAYTTLSITSTTIAVSLPTVSVGGRTVSAVHRVQACQLASTGRWLHPRPQLLDRIARGTTLALTGRSEPDYWCVGRNDTTGTPVIIFMPLPAYADTVQMWYLRSAAGMDMVNNSDRPPFGDEYEGILVERVLASMTLEDSTFDQAVAASHRATADKLFRAMCLTHREMAPPVQSLQWLGHGQV